MARTPQARCFFLAEHPAADFDRVHPRVVEQVLVHDRELLTFLAGAAIAVEPGELECRDAAGNVSVRSIDSAIATAGGILVHQQFATGLSFTTQPCLANTGPGPFLSGQPDEVGIHCTDPLGSIVYHGPASQWTMSGGVLTWREVTSQEILISTLDCFVTGIGDEGRKGR